MWGMADYRDIAYAFTRNLMSCSGGGRAVRRASVPAVPMASLRGDRTPQFSPARHLRSEPVREPLNPTVRNA